MAEKYTQQQLTYLSDNRALMTIDDLTIRFNNKFNQDRTWKAIRGICTKKGFKSNDDGCFRKGFTPWNKGVTGYMGANRTTFKKGNLPVNHVPVGTERVDARDGYIMIKVDEPNVWKQKSHVIYADIHGAVPDNHVVIFIDGDKTNLQPENLEAISRLELLNLNRNGYSTTPKEFKPVIKAVSKLEAAISKNRKA